MSVHFRPRLRILARALQFVFGGFALALLGGVYIIEIGLFEALVTSLVAVSLLSLAMSIEFTLAVTRS